MQGFYAWWGARLEGRHGDAEARPVTIAALVLAIAGLGADLLAKSLYIGWLPDDYETIAPFARVLTGGVGNGLYTLAGMAVSTGVVFTLFCPWAAWMGWRARRQ